MNHPGIGMGPTVGYRYESYQVQVWSHTGIGMEPNIGYRYGSSYWYW